jgi:DNA-binding SARP family transcriptional activator
VPGEERLEIRLLGEMEIVRRGRRLPLPRSRKTRALLAYLVLTARPHRRSRLADLLWDGAEDPRGALRWSLSRMRPLVDEPGHARIHAEHGTVAFRPEGARVDVLGVRERCARGLDGADVAELAALAGAFRGELLEGLALGDYLDFETWCAVERDDARRLHALVRRELVDRLSGDAEAALPHARALASLDPLNEEARAGLVRMLLLARRHHEAERQYEAARRALESGRVRVSGALEDAWRGRARD